MDPLMLAANNGKSLWSGLPFWKMKNEPVNSGPINKTYQQKTDPDPIEEMLEQMKKKAEQIGDGAEAVMAAIEEILKGGGSFDVPIVLISPCQYDRMCGKSAPNP
jgi:hypothetical protein